MTRPYDHEACRASGEWTTSAGVTTHFDGQNMSGNRGNYFKSRLQSLSRHGHGKSCVDSVDKNNTLGTVNTHPRTIKVVSSERA